MITTSKVSATTVSLRVKYAGISYAAALPKQPDRARRVPRFPTRTLILMTLALLAFGQMWWRTHQTPAPEVLVLDGGAP